MKRALVLGLTGQVGSHLAELLLSKGYEVHGIVRRSSAPNYWRIKPILDQLTLHSADLTDQCSLDAVIKLVQPAEVYNLAAQSFVGASWAQPVLTADVTALGVARLLEAVRRFCPEAKVYHASSSEQFGQVTETPQTERTPFHPRSPYGCAKVYAHHLSVNYRESYNLFIACGICFNVEGPRRGEEFVTRKVTMAAARIKSELTTGKQPAPLYLGNLDAARDWGFAGDYVKAMWQMLRQDQPTDYVLATGQTHTIRELCQTAFEAVDLDWTQWVQVDKALLRPAEVATLRGDAGKAARELDWRPLVTFPELVQAMITADLYRLQPR